MEEIVNMRMGEGSLKGLRDLCNYVKENSKTPIKTIVEVGSYQGQSAVVFAQEFPEAIVYCIDPWKNGYDDFDIASQSNMKLVEEEFDKRVADYPNIVKKKGYSTDFSFDTDFVYIDGEHTYSGVKRDITHWKPLTKVAVCGHDYYNETTWEGVFNAVNELLGAPDKVFSESSWVKLLK